MAPSEKRWTRNEPTQPMSTWPRRTTYALLGSFCLVGIVLRYPATNSQIGVDSYSIHALSDLVAGTGRIGWLATPLSYLGLAPFSYSPVVPISLAELESLSGLTGEGAVLAYSLFLGVVLPLTAFLLGYAAFRKPFMGVLASFLISTAGGMVGFTTFTVSTRGAFLTFTPLALALFLDVTLRGRNAKNHGVALILVLTALLFTHAMFVLLVPLLAAVVMLYRVVMTEDRLLIHGARPNRRATVAFATMISMSVLLALFVILGPASQTFTDFPTLQTNLLPNNLLVRMGLQWASLMGIGILFLPLGLLRAPRTAERKRAFLLLALALTFLPLVLNPVYGLLLATPVVLLVASLGILRSTPTRNAQGRGVFHHPYVFAAAVGVAIVVAPMIITIPRTSGVPCNEPDNINPQTYNTGLYLRYFAPANSSFVWDDHIEAERLESISGVPSLEPVLSIGDLEYPWLAREMNPRFSANANLTEFLFAGHQLFDVQEWLSAAGSDYPYYWGKHTFVLLHNAPGSLAAMQILGFYRASLAVERCGTVHSAFYDGLASANYLVYADELQRAYWIRS